MHLCELMLHSQPVCYISAAAFSILHELDLRLKRCILHICTVTEAPCHHVKSHGGFSSNLAWPMRHLIHSQPIWCVPCFFTVDAKISSFDPELRKRVLQNNKDAKKLNTLPFIMTLKQQLALSCSFSSGSFQQPKSDLGRMVTAMCADCYWQAVKLVKMLANKETE